VSNHDTACFEAITTEDRYFIEDKYIPKRQKMDTELYKVSFSEAKCTEFTNVKESIIAPALTFIKTDQNKF